MRLINANALMEFARNHINGMIDCNDIARFPTTDAEPVRHGQWKHTLYDRVGILTTDGDMMCMNCGGRFFRVIGTWYKYCPNCGAKMDLNERIKYENSN